MKIHKSEEDCLLKHFKVMGAKFCAQTLNIKVGRVYHMAKFLGLKYARHYVSRVDISKLLTPKGIYLLGFLWADGSIRKNVHEVRCAFLKSDADVINHIFRYTGDWKEKTFKPKENDGSHRKEITEFSVYDKNFYDFLKESDYRDKSTRTPTKILAKIPPDLRHYFWRGYFDGDGCFHKNIANICGPIEQEWDDFIKLLNNINIQYNFKLYDMIAGKSSRITICGYDNVLKLGIYLYQGELFGLQRKLDKFKSIINNAILYNSKNGYSIDKKRGTYSVEFYIDNRRVYRISGKTKDEAIKIREIMDEKYNSKRFKIKSLINQCQNII